jgi:hypothetical protein
MRTEFRSGSRERPRRQKQGQFWCSVDDISRIWSGKTAIVTKTMGAGLGVADAVGDTVGVAEVEEVIDTLKTMGMTVTS